jgi:hypothetical protein
MRLWRQIAWIISIVILIVLITLQLWDIPPLCRKNRNHLRLAFTAIALAERLLLSAVYRKQKAEDQEKGAEPENEHFE